MKKILFALTLLLSLGSTLWIGQATAKNVSVTIRNSSDWNRFRDEVEKAKGNYRVDATLEADISTDKSVGFGNAPWHGTFRGNGHTININIQSGSNNAALFPQVGNVTITDLHVTGKANGGIHSAGLIGCVIGGTPTINVHRVWVSTETTTTSTHAGGIIGHANSANVNMTDCLFDGKVATNNADYSFAGEIIGWCNGGRWTLDRVYDNGSPVAHWMFYCIDHNPNSGWSSWGSNGSSYTITRHGWTNVNHYNKTDQSEVVNLMNGSEPGRWHLVNGKAVPLMDAVDDNGWKEITNGSNSGYRLISGHYYITKNLTFSNSNAGRDGITIAAGSTVHIYIPKGVTLTAQGGNASGRDGAGAGIYLPQGSTLVLEGEGKVKATGGNAANGSNGSNGGNASADDANCKWIHPGDGGAGGDGGGGAGAGIGTRGGKGGAGGSGVGRGTIYNFSSTNYDGVTGNSGGNGSSASAMGSLYVDQHGVTIDAHGGSAGSSGSAGGEGYRHLHKSTTWDHGLGGGSGGGGGGAGGSAQKIGTGGAGGGGGGSGSSGTTRYCSKWKSGWFSVGSKGGEGGENGDGGNAPNASDAVYYGSRGWESGDNRASGGGRGNRGDVSQYSNYEAHKFYLEFNAVDNNSNKRSAKVTYTSNSTDKIDVTLPAPYAVGMTQTDKYVSSWYTSVNNSRRELSLFDEVNIQEGTTRVYATWKSYKDIFPEGYGTKSRPFIIKEGLLLELADYVNSGANTRDVYFKQSGDIQVADVLRKNYRGSNWVPIGNSLFHVFEGDYDGGGFLIRDAVADSNSNSSDTYGIFGRVVGSIHNLGVENARFIAAGNARCGTIAGMLLDNRNGLAGKITNCYVAKGLVSADYGGVFVGEMEANTSISYCHEFNNGLRGSHAASFSSIIDSNAKVDKCFTGGTSFSASGYNKATNSRTRVTSTQMASGEITWLLNDKAAYGVTWYQDVDREGYRDDYPVLDSISKPVFYYDNKYSNNALGPLSKLTGKGTRQDPFLITSRADLQAVEEYCSKDLRSNGMYFLQTADINLSGSLWKPIGLQSHFSGYYDGGGHTIRNGEIRTGSVAGIFGFVDGTVTRLCVENTAVTAIDPNTYAGVIAGSVTDNGVISHCLVKECTVESVGGFAGAIAGTTTGNSAIRNCLGYKNKVEGETTGDLVGEMKDYTQMSRCFTDGKKMTGPKSTGSVDEFSAPGMDEATLGSGEICFKLNGGSTPDPNWFQNIDQASNRDKIPVLSTSHAIVFNRGGKYTNEGQDLSMLGKGTQEDPYKVGSPADFQTLMYGIAQMKRSNFYVLQTADINLRDSLIAPLGTTTPGFEGHYDGGGHVIKNVKMYNYEGESLGLFNNLLGTVERLGIENCTFQAEGATNRVGAFAGRMSGNAQLRNCYVKNSTIDFNNRNGVVVGGLVGEQTGTSRIENCYGYQNTVKGQDDGLRHYGYIVGYIGSEAKDSLVFTDGPTLCADKQGGLMNIAHSDAGLSDYSFNSGQLCWLLGGAKDASDLWRQTIRTDSSPVLYKQTGNSLPVYAHTTDIKQTLYTNNTNEPATVALTLDPNREQHLPDTLQVLKADTTYYVPGLKLGAHIPELQDLEFVGWNTQADGKGTLYTSDQEMVPSERTTLYALWDLKIPTKMIGTVKVEKLTLDNTPIKVYDAGGSKSDYGSGYNGMLTLKAPDGYVVCLSGTVTTEAPDSTAKPRDYLIVLDGDATSEDRLTNAQAKTTGLEKDIYYSSTDGTTEDIGILISTQKEMTLQFITDGQNSFKGLDLTAKLVKKDLMTQLQNLGKGTKEEPYEVKSLEDLKVVDEYISLTHNSNIHIRQVDSIDLAGKDFTPLASGVERFEGHYDGGGYVIKNMNIVDGNGAAVGFFRNVSGTVERLGMVNSTVKGTAANARVGALAGRLSDGGQVRYCYATGNNITAGNGGAAGALVGELADTTRLESSYGYGNEVNGAQHGAVAGRSGGSAKQNLVIYDQANTESSFRTGEICYQLNGSVNSDNAVWRQTIGTDNLPVLGNSHGVVYSFRIVNNKPSQMVYTNTKELDTILIILHQNDGTGKKHTFVAYRQQSEAESDRAFNLEFAKFAYEGNSSDLKDSELVLWTEQADGKGTRYSRRDMIKPDKDIELYAQWGKEINTKEDFKGINGKQGNFYLMQDLDLGNWKSIGLQGNFDGGGHTIRYNGNSNTSGLFSDIATKASLKHLRVEANIETVLPACGGIALANSGNISDCHFRGNVKIKKFFMFKGEIASIAVDNYGVIDHCSATGTFYIDYGDEYYISHKLDGGTENHCTRVHPTDTKLYIAQTDSALNAQAEYPVYAKGILDVTRLSVVVGDQVIAAPKKHLASLTIVDGQRFICPSEVKVDKITYKRRGTNGAYEPWVLPFDYTIDESMMKDGMEFYRFEKDSTSSTNIATVLISKDKPYQAAANEPLAFRSTGNDEISFEMKLVKDGSTQPMTLTVPIDGVGASMKSTKDVAKMVVTYDSIPADRMKKEMMYVWDNSKEDFVLSTGDKGLQPFRYYLQFTDKKGNPEQYERTDWARRQKQRGGASQGVQQASRRATLSELQAEGWQPIYLVTMDDMPVVTDEMLNDYEILALYDVYDAEATDAENEGRYAVSVFYEPVEAGMELDPALPLLVRAKRADAEPLVTEETARTIDAVLSEMLVAMEEGISEAFVTYEAVNPHYECATFNGRYDVWQMPLPKDDNTLNAFGALTFAAGDKLHFRRVAASDGYSMQPMSYCFTAYNPRTFENLPLVNDRIEVVLPGHAGEQTGIENIQSTDGRNGDRNDGNTYNLSGQKVDGSYRGIVIKNGRKVIVK